ncbi:flagellar motor switch phosphatase FliY [Paenibacillus mucilaginosus]|uniref:Flagellar motor switch protein n=3 Tax=Paenibacillus mucilaginosus TaxID=61624 RepID=H6NQ45_9BACL|nr:flagellar motor switch phosphatase FliY [Paenibacillus mucilaginosus]AEI44331.1 flagellar motor switch protein [Paenibacillus mucilaginosus KNP414]AFC31869.1 flagellar motor switch protein [Paenibacillus mucilaginosus 3016]AFH64226.1 flagellar motor switch protein FliN [Paenibacillus mucilaginosus K02]MCG7217615.1 flagellar motor switch phosphatase FliY [Paenibacillus mucilaginosus]WDM25727.1 flagellar motor switch phosphatase FliY [Paenibacillus mucilaginosus]
MTNKDYLSQEEIDALLKQSSDNGSDEGGTSGSGFAPITEEYLTSLEQDALGEIGNITFGSAATALSTLLGKKVDITTPKVSVIARDDLMMEFPKPHVAINVNYVDGFDGINLLVIKKIDAQVIANLMMGGDGTNVAEEELTEIHVSAVQEAMNQMMGSSATSMSTIFNRFVNISPPGVDIINLSEGQDMTTIPQEDVFIKISFRLTIGDLIDSNIMQLLPVAFAKDMVNILMGGGSTEEVAAAAAPAPAAAHAAPAAAPAPAHAPAAAAPAAAHAAPPQPAYPGYDAYGQPAASMQPPMMPQQPYGQPGYGQPPMYPPMGAPMYPPQPAAYGMPAGRNVNVQPAQFTSFQAPNMMQADDTNLNLLLDIPLKVTVELGRTNKVIKDILELSQGSIIELDKLAGEPVDILVNNKLIAKGEVVVIDENFGVRVTDIVNQMDRLQKLNL